MGGEGEKAKIPRMKRIRISLFRLSCVVRGSEEIAMLVRYYDLYHSTITSNDGSVHAQLQAPPETYNYKTL
jgi:hypothetical protein